MEKWLKTQAPVRKILTACLLAGLLLAAALARFGLAESAPAPPWNPANLAKIAPLTENPLTFAVLGDSRDSHGIFAHILKRISADPELAFVVHLGDLVHRGKPREFQHFFGQVREFLRLPLVAALGNHELDKDLAQPRQPYEALFGPRYYSFTLGPTYFLVLDNADSQGLNDEQLGWLEAELTKAQAYRHRLVFVHVPLFDPRRRNKAHAMPEAEGRRLAEVLRRHRVSHIFAGHIHAYYTGQWEGLPYTITGGGGVGLHGRDPAHDFHHYLKVLVRGDAVKVQVQRVDIPIEMMSLSPPW
jgi:predicted phosphodiesterase